MLHFSDFFSPFRLRRIRRYLRTKAPAILDIGCTGNTAIETRKLFQNAVYDGIDIAEPSAQARSCMRNFYILDVSKLDFSQIQEQRYDLIVLSHVIEHIHNGADVIAAVSQKLNPGGVIYVEYPRAESIGMPNAIGTLQFCDDPTHVRVYTLAEVANAMLVSGLKVVDGGRRRDWILVLLSPLTIPMQIRSYLQYGLPTARGALYDIFGFADYVIGQKSV